jgi:hypothetical protein
MKFGSRLLGAILFSAVFASGAAADVQTSSTRANRDTSASQGSVPIKKDAGDGANGITPRAPKGRRSGSGFLSQTCCAGGNGWAPGEPSIAVGGAHVVETVNSSLTVYAKSNNSLTEVFHQDLTSFFGGGPIACIDPRVIYWSWSDRYALVCSDFGSTPAVVRFAVTTGNDPAQGWNRYVIPAGFLDQPKVEATSDKLVVAGNDGDFEQFYVYALEDILRGAHDPGMVHLTSAHGYYQAAVEQTPASAGYFVSACAGCPLRLATISGTPATSVSLTEVDLGDAGLRPTSDPAVPGGSLGGANMDTRVLTAVYQVVKPHNTPVIQYSANTGCRLGIDTVCTATGRIDLARPTPVLSYAIDVGSSGSAYTYGAVTLDRRGNAYLSYSRSSETSTPSAAVLGLGRGGGRRFDTIIQSSTADTTSCDPAQPPPCDERWGDYLGAAQDAADPRSVWVAGLYQSASGQFGWGTVIARVGPHGLE